MENNKEDKIMKTDIKNYINQFWKMPFYGGGKEDLEQLSNRYNYSYDLEWR